jgi:hypothetical protein
MPTQWALLIGVDYYFPGRQRNVRYDHLRGCVNDVSRIERFLKSIGVQNIYKLVAPCDEDNKLKDVKHSDLPTYQNVKGKIQHITDSVCPGDSVWIHYSGHGILRHHVDEYDSDDGDEINGTAFALTDVQVGGAYLTGYQLGVWVRKLVEVKKTRVTVTLDSCYSGKGFRNSNKVTMRTSQSNTIDKSQLDSDFEADNEAVAEDARMGHDVQSSTRNAIVRKSWLSNPEGCTVLTACRLDQEAGECHLGDPGTSNGIMTHFYWTLSISAESKDRSFLRTSAWHSRSSKRFWRWRCLATPRLLFSTVTAYLSFLVLRRGFNILGALFRSWISQELTRRPICSTLVLHKVYV